MPLVTSVNMLRMAREGGYAVGAFNAENMEMVQAIISAAADLRAPAIIQTTPGTLKYAPPELFYANVAAAAAGADAPIAIHLDHGESFEMAARSVRAGYTSIMFDGSKHPLDENISGTRRVVDMCAPCGLPVEGELGRVGGKEDDTESAESGYTDPDEAVRFVKETGVSSLAVGVGTAHGVYAAEPALNIELIAVLKRALSVPLVLHGASGLTDEVVGECIARGICKVNFATELRIAYTSAVRGYLAGDPGAIDPKKFGAAGRRAVYEAVKHKIEVCGCVGKGER